MIPSQRQQSNQAKIELEANLDLLCNPYISFLVNTFDPVIVYREFQKTIYISYLAIFNKQKRLCMTHYSINHMNCF